MKTWLLEKPGRLGMTLGIVGAVVLVAMMLMINYRVDKLGDSIPTATPDQGVGSTPLDTGDGERLATPEPTPTDGDLTVPDDAYATVTDRAFPDAGDPTPTAIEAVNEWMAWDFQGLEDNLLPGVLEEATANPPQRGTRVDGVARVTTPGPTQSVVTVPTTKGKLNVTLVVTEGKWMIESMGWAPGVAP
jgi:hypothetical protein